MKKALLAVALLASTYSGVACSLSCTEVGCDDGLTINISGFASAVKAASKAFPIKVEACADTRCQTLTVKESNGETTCTLSGSGDCFVDEKGVLIAFLVISAEDKPTISVDVLDAMDQSFFSDSKQIEIDEYKPNGEQCDPTCRQGQADFTIPVK